MKNRGIFTLFAAGALFASASTASALTLTEDFGDPFSDWETRFMGTESNLSNYYVIQNGSSIDDRGNNPDGLWLDDGDANFYLDVVEILFSPSFASSLTSLSFLMSSFTGDVSLEFFDQSGTTLSTLNVVGDGLYTPVLSYGVTSTNGIGGFRLTSLFGAQIEGNTSIDAITVSTGPVVPPVPLPASALLLGAALVGLGAIRRKQVSKNA